MPPIPATSSDRYRCTASAADGAGRVQVHVDCLGPARLWFARERVTLQLPGPQARIVDVLDALAAQSPEFAARRGSVAVALGDAIVLPGQALDDGAAIALIPPVSGG
jgi:molybdopterin converting factor small subunit